MEIERDFSGRQIQGQRAEQEDAYGFCALSQAEDGVDGLLLVLADGMGGHEGGAVASRAVTHAFVEGCLPKDSVTQGLQRGLSAACAALAAAASTENGQLSDLAEMGSTLIGLIWMPGCIQWVSVGDSLLYLYRGESLKRLNEDHSAAAILERMVAMNKISREDADHHPLRHTLFSAITREGIRIQELRQEPFKLYSGDLILAASDGLANAIPDEELAEILQHRRRQTAEQIAESLLAAVEAKRRPRQDNTTVALIKTP